MALSVERQRLCVFVLEFLFSGLPSCFNNLITRLCAGPFRWSVTCAGILFLIETFVRIAQTAPLEPFW